MRDRMIRQKFWASPNHPDDPWARLLFIAMWNWSDDYGVGDCNVRSLLGYAFPNDRNISEAMCEVMLRDIGVAYGVTYYTVGRRPYYAIPTWEAYQYVQHPNKTQRNPLPNQAETWLYRDTFAISDDPLEQFMRQSCADHDEVEVERELEIERERESNQRTPARAPATGQSRACRIPPDFMPSPHVVQAMKAELHVDDSFLHREHLKFVDFWTAKSGANATKKDWDATWRNWIWTAVERSGGSAVGGKSKADRKTAAWAAMGERYAGE